MPRIPRSNYKARYYHVIVQGVNKIYIFDDGKSKYIYLKYLKKFMNELGIELVAYCMMDNHAHFIMRVENVDCLGKCMQYTNFTFSNYYNKVNNRVGVLFRNRYKSEPIEDERYLSQCIKYIHNNPVKAGMVKTPGEYSLSSYNELFYNYQPKYVNKELLINIFGKNYSQIINEASTRVFQDIDENRNVIFSCLQDGLIDLMKKEQNSLVEVLSNRSLLDNIIYRLNRENNVDIKYVLEFFGIPKSTWYLKLNERKMTWTQIECPLKSK